MKRLVAIGLFFVSSIQVFASSNDTIPKTTSAKTDLEMVFVLDTTGSMGGLIDGAKAKIWSIVNGVMSGKDKANVKIGLVAYRDNGDEYVTKVLPLTEDLDKVYTTLMAYRADGGGDHPENVRRALADGVEKAGWSAQAKNRRQIIFLVGDAPPQSYEQEPDVFVTTQKAVAKNMIINTVQCGSDPNTASAWQEIARKGEGRYFAIAQDGGVQSIGTPFDAELSLLAAKLGSTFLAYGGGAGKAGAKHREAAKAEQESVETQMVVELPASSQADRAVNKVLNSSAYVGDLLQAIENGSVKFENVKEEDLPDDLKKLKKAERIVEIEKRLEIRRKIRARILELSKKRQDFINAERKKLGSNDGFDTAVNEALRLQISQP